MRNLAARLDALEAKNNPGRLILIATGRDEDENAAARRKGDGPAEFDNADTRRLHQHRGSAMNALLRRLEALERGGGGAPALVWRERGEDAETALARHLCGRPADAAREVLLVSWER